MRVRECRICKRDLPEDQFSTGLWSGQCIECREELKTVDVVDDEEHEEAVDRLVSEIRSRYR